MTFNLGIFENHLEFHDYSHTHCVDDSDYFTNDQKSDDESDPGISEYDPSASAREGHDINESYEMIETRGELEGIHTDAEIVDTTKEDSTNNDSKTTKPEHQCFQGGYFLLILSNGLSSVALKFPAIAYEDPTTEIVDVITVREQKVWQAVFPLDTSIALNGAVNQLLDFF